MRRTILSLLWGVAICMAGMINSVQGAQIAGQICLHEKPSQVELFAAQELQKYIGQSLGWQIDIKEKPCQDISRPTFVLGEFDRIDITGTKFDRSAISSKISKLTDDGVLIKGKGNVVLLTGKGKRSPLNAVYSFLEEFLGCHWPDPGVDYVPKHSGIKLDGIEYVHSPSFGYRGLSFHGAYTPQWHRKIIDWTAKNRMNWTQVWPGQYQAFTKEDIEGLRKRAINIHFAGHVRDFFYSDSKYFAQHPEHFNMIGGKRQPKNKLCYSNLESIPEYAKNIHEFIKKEPLIKLVGTWPLDGFDWCQCSKCKDTPKTETLGKYLNQLTDELRKYDPEIITDRVAYINYKDVPTVNKPSPYTVPFYCEYWSRNQFHPITDNLLDNRVCRDEMISWANVSSKVLLCSYYGDDCIKRYLYNPIFDTIVADLRYYQIIDQWGQSVLMTNPQSWWSNAPHVYAYARASWDTRLEPQDIEQNYYNSLWDDNAKHMIAHARACRSLFDLETAQGATGETVLFDLKYDKFDPALYGKTIKQGKQAVTQIKDCLSKVDEKDLSPYQKTILSKLRYDADYVGLVYKIVCEAEYYKKTKDELSARRLANNIGTALKNDILANDDARGYRTGRDRLVTIAKTTIGYSMIDLWRTMLENPDLQEVWRWTTADANPSDSANQRKVKIDVTKYIKNAGRYQVVWNYVQGADVLCVSTNDLYCVDAAGNSTLVCSDKHLGSTGYVDTNNIYYLSVDNFEPAAKYFLMASIYDDNTLDTFGQVLLGPVSK